MKLVKFSIATFSLMLFAVVGCNKDNALNQSDITAPEATPEFRRICTAHEYNDALMAHDHAFEMNQQAIEEFTQRYAANANQQQRAVVTIPVVFHVIYNTSAQNVSDAAIQNQLKVLNDDFRKLNNDASGVPSVFAGLVADSEVSFCMAKRTPTGAATTGILRRQTTVTSFSTNNAMKSTSTGGSDAWDRTKYLNIWVCNMGGGILGYAQFPGGAAATDGVVLAFGTLPGGSAAPYNKGRTGTHEVGHWLNLRHIWGDDGRRCTGSDQVADTPNQADENYGCPNFATNKSCSNTGDMSMNYMDYTNDACMYMFTTGQKARMQALFASGGARASLATSNGCTAP